MKSDGKNPATCDLCGGTHYRQHNYCKTCAPAIRVPSAAERFGPVAAKLSDEVLLVFAQEYLRRHQATASGLASVMEAA